VITLRSTTLPYLGFPPRGSEGMVHLRLTHITVVHLTLYPYHLRLQYIPVLDVQCTMVLPKIYHISKQCICLIALKTLDLSISSIFETEKYFLIQNLNISIYFENGLL
jgi:hypothetical protein